MTTPAGADLTQLAALKRTLVSGCRVLANESLVDSSGHLSVRVPGTNQFVIHPRMAPGLATEKSLLIVDETGTVRSGSDTKPLEWPIHAQIYQARPDVQSIMHSHSRMSRLFSVSRVPLRPLYALSFNFFDPVGVPLYRGCGLITTPEDGNAVARALAQGPAVLLRGHGNVVAGESIEQTVVLSVMLEQMAETLHEVLAHGEPEYFTDEEVSLWRERTRFGVQKAWEYYCQRAQAGIPRGAPV